jgi:LacI family transcriptional regulator
MKDIAQALNVSIVTVSKVLNNDPSISEATRERVLAYARQSGYRTNLAAKGLVTGQTKVIGFVVPNLMHGFFSDVAAGMSDVLCNHGYGLIIASSRGDKELERREIQQMLARSVDALVVSTCELEATAFEHVAQEVSLILLDRRVADDDELNFVGTDDRMAGEIATQYLVEMGRRRVAHIGGPDSIPALEREKAYRSVLAREGIEVPPEYVQKSPWNEEASYETAAESMRKLLQLQPRPDAVFCYNDPLAVGAMMAILEAGLRIPEDIAIIGCGNNRYNAFLRVPLTSMDQYAQLLGQEAAKLALSSIEARRKNTPRTQHVFIKPTLVLRDSTSPVAMRAGVESEQLQRS